MSRPMCVVCVTAAAGRSQSPEPLRNGTRTPSLRGSSIPLQRRLSRPSGISQKNLEEISDKIHVGWTCPIQNIPARGDVSVGLALALLGVSSHVGCLLSLVTLPQASERRVLSHTATQGVLCSCGHSRNYWKHTTHDTFCLIAFRPRGLIRLGQQKRKKKKDRKRLGLHLPCIPLLLILHGCQLSLWVGPWLKRTLWKEPLATPYLPVRGWVTLASWFLGVVPQLLSIKREYFLDWMESFVPICSRHLCKTELSITSQVENWSEVNNWSISSCSFYLESHINNFVIFLHW